MCTPMHTHASAFNTLPLFTTIFVVFCYAVTVIFIWQPLHCHWMYREPKSLFSYAVASTESTTILNMIFKLISLCSYRDCVCFELQLIGSCKSSICCTAHLSVQLFSAQKWCMCLPWALWGSHSLLSLCPHCLSCSGCYPLWTLRGPEGHWPSPFPAFALGELWEQMDSWMILVPHLNWRRGFGL